MSLRFELASIAPGGYLFMSLDGRVTTEDVDESGSALLRVAIVSTRSRLNGAAMPTEQAISDDTVAVLSSPAYGGVTRAETTDPRALATPIGMFASLAPMIWPALTHVPRLGEAPVTMSLREAATPMDLTYEARGPAHAAPAAERLVSVRGGMHSNDRVPGRLTVSGVVAFADFGRGIATRVALSGALREPPRGSSGEAHAEVGLTVAERGAGDTNDTVAPLEGAPTLPAAEPGGLLLCARAVDALRARLDATEVAPFVLAHPPHALLLAASAQQAQGPALILDLDPDPDPDPDHGHPASVLFATRDDPLALDAAVAERLRGISDAAMLAMVTNSQPPAPDAPVYVRAAPNAPASFVVAITDAVARTGSAARLVVRRAPAGPRADLLGGGLFPFAELLVRDAARCPLLTAAFTHLDEREIANGPSFLRAVLAGGIGTCGCDPVLADELATNMLAFTDAAMQSYGYLDALPSVHASSRTGATVAVDGSDLTLASTSTFADLIAALDTNAARPTSDRATRVRFRD